MRTLSPKIRQDISAMEDELVEKAREVTNELWKVLNEKQRKDGKVRQLRNILEVAESTDSWKALALFIQYQAARGELDIGWAEKLIEVLEDLKGKAHSLTKKYSEKDEKNVHLELVTRVLGHAVRWHLWDVKKREE